MQYRLKLLCVLVLCVTSAAIAAGQDERAPTRLQSVAPIFRQNSMNVFRRFSADPPAMFEFYGKVLGLKQLQTFNLGGNTTVSRFQAGASQVKLTKTVPNRRYYRGGVRGATGLRLLTFFLKDDAPLVERFRAHGLQAPDFQAIPGTDRRSAIVNDPDGQPVQLITVPDASPEIYDQIEIGLTVSDLSESRKFYREFVGLKELPPVDDPIFHTKKYSFRHGSTIISLRSFGKQLPADTGSGGIQYVVSDAKAVEALAKTRHITIEQPLSTLAAFSLTTIWLDDPDGITNYFAQTGVSRRQAAKR